MKNYSSVFIILIIIPDLRLLHSLEKLNKQLFDLIVNCSIFESWWQTKHLAWVEELNTTISYYRNIQSHDYNDFSDREILKLYYDTNTFLIDYLERNQKLTIALRRKICLREIPELCGSRWHLPILKPCIWVWAVLMESGR